MCFTFNEDLNNEYLRIFTQMYYQPLEYVNQIIRNMSAPLVCITDFEEKAKEILEEGALGYYNSGAGEQFSLNLNKEAFRRLRIRPQYLRNVSQVDISCRILGCDLKWPLGISPTAMQKMAHDDGEIGNAKAVGNMGSIFILSSSSTIPIEEVADAAPYTNKWLQIYLYKDRPFTEKLVRRAEKCKFKAIVLTVDFLMFGQRWVDEKSGVRKPTHLRLANFPDQSLTAKGSCSGAIGQFIGNDVDLSCTWKDVKWLVEITHLPVIAKGILTAEGAILAREAGCAAVIVSNHGGRHLDSVPASIEVLPEVVEAVGNDIVVMLDGGVRNGNDMFKALALGAKMVFLGRPAIWGLACGGENGVIDMLEVLKKDFSITMTLAGCRNLNEIKKSMVVHESAYAKL